MGRIRYFGFIVSFFVYIEFNEDWVSYFDQYVVYIIDMDIFDFFGFYIFQYIIFM